MGADYRTVQYIHRAFVGSFHDDDDVIVDRGLDVERVGEVYLHNKTTHGVTPIVTLSLVSN